MGVFWNQLYHVPWTIPKWSLYENGYISLKMGRYLLWPPVWLVNGMVFKAWVCHMFVESPNQSSNKILVLVWTRHSPKDPKVNAEKDWKRGKSMYGRNIIEPSWLHTCRHWPLGLWSWCYIKTATLWHQTWLTGKSMNFMNWPWGVLVCKIIKPELGSFQQAMFDDPGGYINLKISTSKSDQLRL